ncbi:MAG: hypothetical protein K6G26_04355 [Lachnospiraceae bacterium]|nr:hypothetical protein [Lachnospiraceae bacterium]
MDGGNDIYAQIYPFWDGEDEYFDLKRVAEEELFQFTNLKRIEIMNSAEKGSKIKNPRAFGVLHICLVKVKCYYY